MITADVIKEIYKKYPKRPKSVDCLDFPMLFEGAGLTHNLMVDPETQELTVASLSPDSPFRTLSLDRVHAFLPFEEWVAIVMHSSILFLNKKKPIASVHIKEPELSLWDRIKNKMEN